MSEGDVSLAAPTKFRKFSRRERRFLLRALEDCGEITEDMLRWKGYWVRLGEILHPFEYKDRYPKVYEAFDTIRNDRPFASFNSKVEAGLKGGDLGPVIGLLRQTAGGVRTAARSPRCGSGAGRAPWTRSSRSPIGSPRRSSSRSPPLQRPLRGSVAAGVLPEGKRRQGPGPGGGAPPAAARSDGLGARTACGASLCGGSRALPPLGKVWVDEGLKSYLVPFARRSASKSLRTVARGSRLDSARGRHHPVLPLVEERRRAGLDIDLSAVLFAGDWTRVRHLAYFNLREPALGCYHSGDIVDAPEGACEFIDMDVKALSLGACATWRCA